VAFWDLLSQGCLQIPEDRELVLLRPKEGKAYSRFETHPRYSHHYTNKDLVMYDAKNWHFTLVIGQISDILIHRDKGIP